MICDRCKKREANTYLRTEVNGRVSEEHLCSECARLESNMEDNYFSNFFDDFFTPSLGLNFDSHFPFTPAFGFSGAQGNSILDQAKKSIKIGADKFREDVKDNPNSLKILNLRRELNEVVEKEDYERASEIKKEIDALEKGDKNVQ